MGKLSSQIHAPGHRASALLGCVLPSSSRTMFLVPLVFLTAYLLCSSSNLWAKTETSPETIKSAYLNNFLKYIEWPEEDQLQTLIVGFYAGSSSRSSYVDNSAFYERFKRLSRGLVIRGLPLEVRRYKDLLTAKQANMLVISPSLNEKIKEISVALLGSRTLLITEANTQKHSIMINLTTPKKNIIAFEMNKANVLYEGLIVSPDIILFGGTELDVAVLYKETELDLLKVKSRLGEQKKKLFEQAKEIQSQLRKLTTSKKAVVASQNQAGKLRQQINKRNAEISNQKMALVKLESTLKSTANKSKQLTQALNENQDKLDVANKYFKTKQIELAKKESELASIKLELAEKQKNLLTREQVKIILEEEVASNLTILKQQNRQIEEHSSQIERQKQALKDQGAVIETQSNMLTLMFIVAGLTIVLLLVTISSYVQKRKAANALKKARNAADDANAAKSDFLARMSHEIRTPMNAIIGMSDLALGTDLTHQQKDYISKTHRAALALLGIIDDILDFSKIEAGKMVLESIPFYIDDLLADVASVVAGKAEEKGLELIFHAASSVPIQIKADMLRLRQVIVNLVNNAIKFTETGEIIVEVTLIEKQSSRLILKCSVEDSGIGVSNEKLDRLFQPFSQADLSTTRRYGGSGLGLSICLRLTKLMGGKIWADSTPGKGSNFQFTFCSEVVVEADVARHRIPSELAGMKVLIVDDSEAMRSILGEALRDFGFLPDVASSGEEAMKKVAHCAHTQPYRLILMDWELPGIDGLKATQKIKQIPELKPLPKFIMVTIHSRDEFRLQAKKEGVSAFLIKPVSRSMLLDSALIAFNKKISKTSPFDSAQSISQADLKAIEGAYILLVEDNAVNQQVAGEFLQRAGFRVDIANDGGEAVTRVQQQHYDLVFMDIEMPVKDGLDATREIRKLGSTSPKLNRLIELPIIAMTAHAMVGDKEKSLQAGMNDHITKPLSPDAVKKILHTWIKPKQFVPSRKALPEIENKLVEIVLPEEDPLVRAASGNSLLRPLAECIGMNIASGVDRVGNDADAYIHILKLFAKTNQKTIIKLQSAIDITDYDAVLKLVHTVNGASANIGAEGLAQHAGAVELACHEKDFGQARIHVKRLEEELTKVLAAIGMVLDETSKKQTELSHSESKAVMNKETLLQELDQLANLVQTDIVQARTALIGLRDALEQHECDAFYLKMQDQLESFNTLAILKSLEQLQGRLN